jgi:hypothetical protein
MQNTLSCCTANLGRADSAVMTWQKMVAESVPAKPAPAGAGTRPKQGKPRGSNGSARQGDTQAIDGLAKELNV